MILLLLRLIDFYIIKLMRSFCNQNAFSQEEICAICFKFIVFAICCNIFKDNL